VRRAMPDGGNRCGYGGMFVLVQEAYNSIAGTTGDWNT
jgi:hypothetical protein